MKSKIIELFEKVDRRAAKIIAEVINKYTAGVQLQDPRPFTVKEIHRIKLDTGDMYGILLKEFGDYLKFDAESFDQALKNVITH